MRYRLKAMALVLTTIALTATVAGGCSASGPAPAARRVFPPFGGYKLVKAGTLTVGADTSFAPFETLKGTVPEGFDVDLADAIGRELGLKVAYKTQPFETLIPSLLERGNYDVIISAMPITPQRRTQIDFSDPYLTVDQAITMQDRSTLSTSTDLKGKILAVVGGTTGQKWARTNATETSRTVAFDDLLSAFAALQAGNVDAVVADAPITYFLLTDKSRGLRIVKTIKTGEQYGVGVRKEDAALRDAIDDALRRMKASGEYKGIYRKWFGVEPQ